MKQCFENWLSHTGMTEMEKEDCRRRAAQSFERPAKIFLLGDSRKIQYQLLLALGIRPAPRQGSCRLGNWQIQLCPKHRRRNLPTQLQDMRGVPEENVCVILLATGGRGGRLRARDAWHRACRDVGEDMRGFSVLAVQVGADTRQERGEALLQQVATDFLGRQVPVFTVPTGRRGRHCRERLWYQLAKLL